MFQDWDPFPIPPPCEELRVVFDLEEAGLQRSRAVWTVPSPRGLRPIKVPRPHVSGALVSSTVCFSGKCENSSGLSSSLLGSSPRG